ncbi:hypothetical protein [Actinoplanes sp. NBRC 101535]|uniref:diaminopimelate decarboxylase family protein n=1 Tax=Actinoplanes sp. NBRC 101535 TaxID=3032196 RepID=UPI0024A1FE2C|nr:hypothetical protein [Actinoplanes sp. NBRC 101535]GLY04124.1 diaminopimelate decarboxylase [Actinoplanes sp. NBRC 101535]
MTLAELIPSLGVSLRAARLDADLWPASARWGEHGDLLIGGVRAGTVAAAHGTGVHLLDGADVRARCAAYAAGFGSDAVAYSARAGLTVGTGRWIAGEGLGCHVGSAAELRTALVAGFRPERIVMSGSGKSVADREAAYACGAALVVGTPAEIQAVIARAPAGQRVFLRVVPSAVGGRHARYGFRPGSRSALAAVEALLARRDLRPVGVDCSAGHRISRFGAFENCLRDAMEFGARVYARHGLAIGAVNLGGGQAVPCASGDDGFAVAPFAARMRALMRLAADRHRMPEPRLTVSPGRSVTARAGVALHRVTSVTVVDGVLRAGVDGNLGCGPHVDCAGRHATALIGRVSSARALPASLTGEPPVRAGGTLTGSELPADTAVGDLIAIAGVGAYHGRGAGPTVLGVGDGVVRTLAARESWERLLQDAA